MRQERVLDAFPGILGEPGDPRLGSGEQSPSHSWSVCSRSTRQKTGGADIFACPACPDPAERDEGSEVEGSAGQARIRAGRNACPTVEKADDESRGRGIHRRYLAGQAAAYSSLK